MVRVIQPELDFQVSESGGKTIMKVRTHKSGFKVLLLDALFVFSLFLVVLTLGIGLAFHHYALFVAAGSGLVSWLCFRSLRTRHTTTILIDDKSITVGDVAFLADAIERIDYSGTFLKVQYGSRELVLVPGLTFDNSSQILKQIRSTCAKYGYKFTR